MLKQMIEFAQKSSDRQWNETRLEKYLKEKKRNFFFVVATGNGLTYNGFRIVGVENPFSEEKNLSKSFINLEKWMEQNRNLLKYTEFSSYRKPVGSHNSCLGSNNGLGTVCLSHFELEKGGKIFKDEKKKVLKDKAEIHKLFKDRINAHTNAIDDDKLKELCIDREKLKKFYIDFFDDLFKNMSEESLKQVFKHEVIIFSDKILGVRRENKGLEFKIPKYFNVQKADKKPFIILSRTRPPNQYNLSYSLLISENDQKELHDFVTKILPDIEPPFILPLEGELQKKLAKNIALNEKNFFGTVENLLGQYKEGKFNFYFVDIRQGKKPKIEFYDYVSNYQYNFSMSFYNVFPLYDDMKSIPFNRRNLKENFSNMFGQNNLPCLPWVELPKKNKMNTLEKSLYFKFREKLFETIYLGKRILTESEIKNLCLMLIEDGIINEDYNKTKIFSNEVLNMFINHYLYTIGGENVGDSLISKAKEIQKQIANKEFNPLGKESGFYLLGLLLKRLCDKSETSNEKSRLLQPIINTHTIFGLNKVVREKFVEKYAYKIGENDNETRELINKVLPFFAEQDGEEPTKDSKLWLYAGFFSNNDG